MRLVFGFVLAACVSLLPLALGGDNASAGIVCGNFDGKFTCRSDSSAAKQFGKNATPGAPINNQDSSPERIDGRPGRHTSRRGRLEYRSRHRGRNARCGGLPTRNGRHAAQLPMPEELGIAGRQLRALHRVGVQQRARLGRHAASLPERRGESLLHHAPGRLEGLLLRDLRQILGEAASGQRRCGPSGWPWLNSMM